MMWTSRSLSPEPSMSPRCPANNVYVYVCVYEKAARRWAAARDDVVSVVPVLTKLIIALAVVSSIVAVGYYGVTGTLSFSAAHVQAHSFEATDSQATFTWSTASQATVAEPTRIHVCTYPCMCSFRACSRRWTRP